MCFVGDFGAEQGCYVWDFFKDFETEQDCYV